MTGAEWSIIWTIIGTGAAIIIGITAINVALLSWLRSDMKGFEEKMEKEVRKWGIIMHRESRDFHGRLCIIEERNKKK